jgi:hypothetical protein
MEYENQVIEIEVDIDDTYEAIVLTLKVEKRTIVLSLTLQEAQVLSSMVNEAVSNALLASLGLEPSPETRH